MTGDASEIRVKVADYAVAADGVIATIGLGSCVAIALYDPTARVGGLAHILLPDESMSRMMPSSCIRVRSVLVACARKTAAIVR